MLLQVFDDHGRAVAARSLARRTIGLSPEAGVDGAAAITVVASARAASVSSTERRSASGAMPFFSASAASTVTPTHTRRDDKLYRYYVSTDALKRDAEACPVRRVPAAEIESAVIEQVRAVLRSPEIIVRTWRVARQSMEGLTEADVREALERLDPLWDELFPAEQARIVQLLVERVDVSTEGADIRLRTEGLTSLVADLSTIQPQGRRAA
jgi:hypothetical protein